MSNNFLFFLFVYNVDMAATGIKNKENSIYPDRNFIVFQKSV